MEKAFVYLAEMENTIQKYLMETIGKTEAMAISKWLPKSNYRPLNKGYLTGRMKSGAPDIEYYGKDGLVEVWIAVREN